MYRINFPKNSGDRFIPLRISIDDKVTINNENHDFILFNTPLTREERFVNYARVRYNHLNFKNTLRGVLQPLDVKTLNFFPPKEFTTSRPYEETWPVRARKKPVIGPPKMVLDMPQFDTNFCHHVADWSSHNCLATIFEGEVHMCWYPYSEPRRERTNTEMRAHNCVKWKSGGVELAVGITPNGIGIWNTSKKKLTHFTWCCAVGACHIHCLEWIYDCLISGCSNGVLRVFNSDLEFLKMKGPIHKGGIINIVTSCNKSYIATSGLDKSVIVWKMPQLEGLFRLKFDSDVRAIAWHPWKSFLLAVGPATFEGSAFLINVNTRKQIGRLTISYKYSQITSLTFNPISAELVVAYAARRERNNEIAGIIAVFSNKMKIVEELHMHDGAIPYLLWDSEGRVLASASADENLCLWDFFGSPNKQQKYVGKTKSWFNNNSVILRTVIR